MHNFPSAKTILMFPLQRLIHPPSHGPCCRKRHWRILHPSTYKVSDLYMLLQNSTDHWCCYSYRRWWWPNRRTMDLASTSSISVFGIDFQCPNAQQTDVWYTWSKGTCSFKQIPSMSCPLVLGYNSSPANYTLAWWTGEGWELVAAATLIFPLCIFIYQRTWINF